MSDQQDAGHPATVDSAVRKTLLFIIVLLIPVIGMLAFLNVRKHRAETTEQTTVPASPEGRFND